MTKEAPTEKQLGVISYLLKSSGSKSSELLINKISNDIDYAKKFISNIHPLGDYRYLCVVNRIKESMSKDQVSYLIGLFEDFRYKDVESILKRIGVKFI